MNERHSDQLPEDLVAMADRLERNRPITAPLELDRIKLRAQRQGARSQAKGQFLKSRVAIMSVLALGILMSGTGATLAVSGSSDNGSAGQAQYPQAVAPGQDQSGAGGGDTLAGADQGPTDSAAPTPTPSGADAQPDQQEVAASTGDSLPFTGLAAIPLLVIGLAMLGGGAVLQRRSRRA